MKKLLAGIVFLLLATGAEAEINYFMFEKNEGHDLVRFQHKDYAARNGKHYRLEGVLPGENGIRFCIPFSAGQKEVLIPFMLAKRIRRISFLLENGSGVSERGQGYFQPSERAILPEPESIWSDPGVIAFFQDKPVSPESTRNGDLLLLLAAAMKRTDCALQLLEAKKADPMAMRDIFCAAGEFEMEGSPLFHAALNNDKVLYDALLAAGAVPDPATRRTYPPTSFLSEFMKRGKSVEMLRHMVEKGLKVKESDGLAACSGASRSDATGLEMMKYLISLGIPLDYRTTCLIRHTPIEYALQRGSREMILLLLNSGVPLEERLWQFGDEQGGEEALPALAEYANRNGISYEPFAIGYGEDLGMFFRQYAKYTGNPGDSEPIWIKTNGLTQNGEVPEKHRFFLPDSVFVCTKISYFSPGQPVRTEAYSGWGNRFREILKERDLPRKEADVLFNKCVELYRATPVADREKVLQTYLLNYR